MNADRLREAARVLRERAEAAPPGPWSVGAGHDGNPANGPTTVELRSPVDDHHPMLVGDYDQWSGHAAEHAATMHPGVALALADWLDETALWMPIQPEPLAVADAILGKQP